MDGREQPEVLRTLNEWSEQFRLLRTGYIAPALGQAAAEGAQAAIEAIGQTLGDLQAEITASLLMIDDLTTPADQLSMLDEQIITLTGVADPDTGHEQWVQLDDFMAAFPGLINNAADLEDRQQRIGEKLAYNDIEAQWLKSKQGYRLQLAPLAIEPAPVETEPSPELTKELATEQVYQKQVLTIATALDRGAYTRNELRACFPNILTFDYKLPRLKQQISEYLNEQGIAHEWGNHGKAKGMRYWLHIYDKDKINDLCQQPSLTPDLPTAQNSHDQPLDVTTIVELIDTLRQNPMIYRTLRGKFKQNLDQHRIFYPIAQQIECYLIKHQIPYKWEVAGDSSNTRYRLVIQDKQDLLQSLIADCQEEALSSETSPLPASPQDTDQQPALSRLIDRLRIITTGVLPARATSRPAPKLTIPDYEWTPEIPAGYELIIDPVLSSRDVLIIAAAFTMETYRRHDMLTTFGDTYNKVKALQVENMLELYRFQQEVTEGLADLGIKAKWIRSACSSQRRYGLIIFSGRDQLQALCQQQDIFLEAPRPRVPETFPANQTNLDHAEEIIEEVDDSPHDFQGEKPTSTLSTPPAAQEAADDTAPIPPAETANLSPLPELIHDVLTYVITNPHGSAALIRGKLFAKYHDYAHSPDFNFEDLREVIEIALESRGIEISWHNKTPDGRAGYSVIVANPEQRAALAKLLNLTPDQAARMLAEPQAPPTPEKPDIEAIFTAFITSKIGDTFYLDDLFHQLYGTATPPAADRQALTQRLHTMKNIRPKANRQYRVVDPNDILAGKQLPPAPQS